MSSPEFTLREQEVGANVLAQNLAFATFLLKIILPGTAVRDRPDRASPRKTKKAGDFPARKPDEASTTTVTRKIRFHLLDPWMTP